MTNQSSDCRITLEVHLIRFYTMHIHFLKHVETIDYIQPTHSHTCPPTTTHPHLTHTTLINIYLYTWWSVYLRLMVGSFCKRCISSVGFNVSMYQFQILSKRDKVSIMLILWRLAPIFIAFWVFPEVPPRRPATSVTLMAGFTFFFFLPSRLIPSCQACNEGESGRERERENDKTEQYPLATAAAVIRHNYVCWRRNCSTKKVMISI